MLFGTFLFSGPSLRGWKLIFKAGKACRKEINMIKAIITGAVISQGYEKSQP